MLGKLIKYEFKATGRLLIPLYGALIIFAFISKIFMRDFFYNNDTILGNLPQIIAILVYVGIMVAIFVVTVFIIIQRYRTNLLCDEGYLMNTIPVKSWENILSKLIVALAWSIASIVVSVISIIILAYKKGLFTKIITTIPVFFNDVNKIAGTQGFLIILEIILMMIINLVFSILMIYASLSIGSLFQKQKILASFGAFIVLNIATNTIASMVQLPLMLGLDLTGVMNNSEITAVSIFIGVMLGISILFSVVYFIISNYILNKKLNLD